MQDNLYEVRVFKIKSIIYFFWISVALIMIRLAYLQIGKNNELEQLGRKNYTITDTVPALRGNFIDCNGYLLVSCRPIAKLYWQGSGNRSLSLPQEELLSVISSALSAGSELAQTIRQAEKQKRKVLLREDVDLKVISKIYEQSTYKENLLLDHGFKRVYPYGSLASHIIGYLNRIDVEGRAGLERYFDNQLQGQKGYVTHIKNAVGKKVILQDQQQAQSGCTVQVTLDIRLQHLAENLFNDNQVGSLLVIDPEDGAIRASVSHPSFDPNLFLRPISTEAWKNKICVHNALLNRVSFATYPPASLFKLITLAAGCEEGIVDYDTKINCKGFVDFCGRKYHCMRRWGHGSLNIKQALARSCNIHCYEIALKIDIDTLASYAFEFGLGRKSNFLLGEDEGLIPTSAWKKRVKNESWWRGETISASIGQSYMKITPLQAARMIGAIYKGFLVKPRILVDEPIEKEMLSISPQTLEFLKDSMHEAVKTGTVKTLNSLEEFDIFAKTGTAQTCSLDKKIKNKTREQIEHAWFSGCFQYKDHRPLVIVAFLEHVGSSRYALMMAKKFFEGYKKLYEQVDTSSQRKNT